MLIQPDFSDIKDQVAPGEYSTRIIDAKVDQWEGKDGKPSTTFINWTLETFAEAEEKNNGRRIWHKTPVSGGGAFRLQEFYKAAMGTDCPKEGFDYTTLFGKELKVIVIDGVDRRTGQPSGYTEVKTVKPM